MSTVKTPTGEVLENVHGQELDYYRGEGYEVLDDADMVGVEVALGETGDASNPPGEGEAEGEQIVQLPEGQYADENGVVRYSETKEPVDPQPADPGSLDLH